MQTVKDEDAYDFIWFFLLRMQLAWFHIWKREKGTKINWKWSIRKIDMERCHITIEFFLLHHQESTMTKKKSSKQLQFLNKTITMAVFSSH